MFACHHVDTTSVQGAFLLDVVARQYPATLELLHCGTRTVLVWRFHVGGGVGRLNVGHNGTRERLDEDLRATTQTQTQVQGAFLLDVVTRQRAAMPELLACETQTLLV